MTPHENSTCLSPGRMMFRRVSWGTLLTVILLVLPRVSMAQNHSVYDHVIDDIQQKIGAHEYDGARHAIADAERTYPNNGGLENLLGVVEIQQGNRSEAIKAFTNAIADDPRLLGALMNLSRIRMETAGQDKSARESALRLSQKVLELDPHNDEAHYQVATILFWDGQYRASLQHLAHLTAGAQSQVGAEALGCADESSLSDRQAASSAVSKLETNPDLSEQDAGVCLQPLRKARRADLIDQLYTAIASRQSLSPSGLRILGLAQEAEHNLPSARETLEKAFAAESSSPALLEDLTRIALAAGDNQGALGYLAHARALQPENSGYAYEFGVICARMGLFAEARKALDQALQAEPENAQYNLGMGMVVALSEDPSQALPYLTRYHGLRPADAGGVLALGTANYNAKDYDEAAKWFRQALTHPQTVPEAHLYLGRIARQEGKLDEAAIQLKQCLAMQPDQADALAELGQISLATRSFSRAEDNFQHALKSDPDNYAANFGLLQLYARTGDARRDQQSQRFDQIKNLRDQRDRQRMRAIEIRPDGTSNSPD